MEEQIVVYPTMPDSEGFYIENADDAAQEITTQVYANGIKVKKTILPTSTSVVVVRELLGKDTKKISRFMDKDPEKYQTAALTAASTIDGKEQTFEFFDNLKMKDFNRILSMYQDLNF